VAICKPIQLTLMVWYGYWRLGTTASEALVGCRSCLQGKFDSCKTTYADLGDKDRVIEVANSVCVQELDLSCRETSRWCYRVQACPNVSIASIGHRPRPIRTYRLIVLGSLNSVAVVALFALLPRPWSTRCRLWTRLPQIICLLGRDSQGLAETGGASHRLGRHESIIPLLKHSGRESISGPTQF
jgi:hypothetical protein